MPGRSLKEKCFPLARLRRSDRSHPVPRLLVTLLALASGLGTLAQGALPTWEEQAADAHALLAFLASQEPRTPDPVTIPAQPLDSLALVKRASEWTPTSRTSWPPKVRSARLLPKLTSPTIKGIGGVDQSAQLSDLIELGVGHATVNIHLNHLLHTEERQGTKPHSFANTRYHVNQRWLRKLDSTIGFLTRNKIVVSAIILITPPRSHPRHLMIHPEADPAGTLAMPNLATMEGAKCYAAALDLLAERYTREDTEFGRITNWIAHNEVDQAWTWTNMGEQPMPRFLETYYRSLRLIHYSARKYDPHARVFASFTHHWFHPGDGTRSYRTREMLRLLNQLSKAEGDFEWGVAYHPYPQDLRQQRTWEDRQPTFSFDTPKITMRNIEVLAAYLRQPEFLFEGRSRPIMLSEQGFHTPTYSAAHQRDQAAALVYTWQKLKALPGIEAFHYHRWGDHPHEGGLRLGLRTLPSQEHPLGEKKRAWSLYRALGTPQEADATAFALESLGVPNLQAIPYPGSIPAP